jgi:hypothetical protein
MVPATVLSEPGPWKNYLEMGNGTNGNNSMEGIMVCFLCLMLLWLNITPWITTSI